MIEKAERNNQATVDAKRDDRHEPRWRSGEIGVHEHAWVPVGADDQGDTYKECSICDARTNTKGARDKARFQDWLEYRAEWGDEPGASAPELVADDPVKTAAVIARTAEAVKQAKDTGKDKDVEIVEPVADDQAKTAAVVARTAEATKTDDDEDEEGELPKRGPGRPRKY